MSVAIARPVGAAGRRADATLRRLLLACVLLVPVVVLPLGRSAATPEAARWPTDDSVYAVDGWTLGQARVDIAPAQFRVVSRTYTRADGTSAELALWTSPDAKRIYRAGPEVPYLNAGYRAEPAPVGLVPAATRREALLLRKDSATWLELHAYGERRGMLGAGLQAWAGVVLDSLVGRPNDYYLIRLTLPLVGDISGRARDAAHLMDVVAPRLSAWYAS
jgi:hypothetical protein